MDVTTSKSKDNYVHGNSIEALESDYLYVETSQIQNAGSGLYAAIDIFRDEIISLFKGESITNEQAEKRVLQSEDAYFINMLDGSIMDSRNTTCYAKYANDAEGFSKGSFENNAEITLDDDDNVCLKAIRKIKNGEEVFCSYGRPYWTKHS